MWERQPHKLFNSNYLFPEIFVYICSVCEFFKFLLYAVIKTFVYSILVYLESLVSPVVHLPSALLYLVTLASVLSAMEPMGLLICLHCSLMGH